MFFILNILWIGQITCYHYVYFYSGKSLELRLYNTLSRTIEIFKPIDASNIKMYVCGPTVYDRAHIGNARPAIVFDVLYRLLQVMYENVTYVRNITDVDDKIYKRATEQNISINELTQQTIQMYHDDMSALNILSPTIEPKATEHIEDIIAFIQILLDEDKAYISNDHVYFDVTSFNHYGKLSNKKTEELSSGARISISEHKRNPLDFVLWKPKSSQFNIGWESPFGIGRPGWHIECSAMAKKYLGDVFDIHGGGIDLVFPHHENEIAQSCSVSKLDRMANYWIHNGHVTLNNSKMSKSEGNFVTIHELLKQYDGEVIRLALLMTQYAAPINFNTQLLQQAKAVLDKWYTQAKHDNTCTTLSADVFSSLCNNLNTPSAITALHSAFLKQPEIATYTARTLLGILNKIQDEWFKTNNTIDTEWIEDMIKKRNNARKNKDYIMADKIRQELINEGIIIEDTQSGTIWKRK